MWPVTVPEKHVFRDQLAHFESYQLKIDRNGVVLKELHSPTIFYRTKLPLPRVIILATDYVLM